MGLILDTCIFIQAERTGLTALEIIGRLSSKYPAESLGTSVVTLTELAQGQVKIGQPNVAARRGLFVQAIRAAIPCFPIDERLALDAGHLSGRIASVGHTIGFADTLIAATALQRGFGVVTFNTRHFGLVPGLQVLLP